MAYLTFKTARAASSQRSPQVVEKSLRASASASPRTATYDVFLSHCIEDALAVEGIAAILERSGLDVYVDWIQDPQLNRTSVTVKTASVLRGRLRQSRSLIFATSDASPTSKWMPWELGYFDGYRPDRIAILPVTATSSGTFVGQEYLGLYPYFEDVGAFVADLRITLGDGRTVSVPEFIRDGVYRRSRA